MQERLISLFDLQESLQLAFLSLGEGQGEGTLVQDFAQFRSQLAQHFVFCLPDGSRCHIKIRGYVNGRTSLDRGLQKRVPGPLFELVADQFQRPMVQTAAFLVVRRFGLDERIIGNSLQPDIRASTANSVSLILDAPEMYTYLISCDGPHPTAKRISRPISAKAVDLPCNGRKHLLHDVAGVLAVQARSAAQGEDDGAVQID